MNYLCSKEMNNEFMDKKLYNWQRTYDMSFEDKKAEVQRIENSISDIVCDDDPLHLDVLSRKEELLMLLEHRQTLLNWMFLETKEEIKRMKVLNSRLFNLTNQLRVKMADVCEELASCPKDSLTDDFEVIGLLKYSYNDMSSVLPYNGDDVYGSNSTMMISLNNWLTGEDPLHYLELHCRYDDCREVVLQSGLLDDGNPWAHDISGSFNEIAICHTTKLFACNLGYPLVDVLHLNDFRSEVKVVQPNLSR